MLLGDHVLKHIAHVWRYRERVEWEAADLFESLASQLRRQGDREALAVLADEAAEDERRHAKRCRALVDRFEPGLVPLRPTLGTILGTEELTPRKRTLYTSVAISCVTETLSTSMLLAMREESRDELVCSTVREILRDEVRHSRLGWAHLATEATKGDVSWLSPYIARMLKGARDTESRELDVGSDLSDYGILQASRSAAIFDETVSMVLLPGFAQFGISVQ